MEETIAFCGLDCSQCPSFLATRADDDKARNQVSKWLARTYDIHIPPREINCDGCQDKNGRRLSYCAQCKVRACAVAKEFSTCAQCPDQPCADLKTFHAFSPEAEKAFNRLVKTIPT
ncbi:MAG: DUF3795 domain-containing protein [Desulfobacterales bacterium]|nr:DUF3795 domain-containing protein [Desulfobacterales bacterium]